MNGYFVIVGLVTKLNLFPIVLGLCVINILYSRTVENILFKAYEVGSKIDLF